MAWESDGGDDAARARELAIAKHDREASEFEEEYRTLTKNGYLATAFLLGREKIDRIVYRELSRHDRSARILDVGCGTGTRWGRSGISDSRCRGWSRHWRCADWPTRRIPGWTSGTDPSQPCHTTTEPSTWSLHWRASVISLPWTTRPPGGRC